MEDLSGKQLGPYQVLAPLGEGGMAAVYKAFQPALEREVALKIMPRHFAADPEFVTRFGQEARTLARLQHPHILPVLDFGETDGYTYIVMPFVAGGTLTAQMRGEPLPLTQARRVTAQVGDALDYAHQRGLIHRDVKPSNILIDERGNCLLTDFGLAKIVESSAHLTASGAILGTPAYMSPEQGLGLKLDPRTDVYSLGVVIYEMATGRIPYSAETPMAVVIKHIHDPLPLPRAVNPALPEGVERVILKALAKKPEDRFATAAEMVKAMRAALPEGDPAPARPQPPAAVLADQIPTRALPPKDRAARVKAARRGGPGLWPSIWVTVAGWCLGLVLGGVIATWQVFIGGLLGGAAAGLGLGLAWRRLESAVTRRQVALLAGLWALVIGFGLLLGGGLILVVALGGLLTGLLFRQTQPAFSVRRAVVMGVSWGLLWLAGGILLAWATNGLPEAGRAVVAVITVLSASVACARVTFGLYQGVREKVKGSKGGGERQ